MARKGRCAACGSARKLSSDHVPPQSVVPPRPVEVKLLANILGTGERLRAPRPGFAAKEFHSLCEDCNGRLLGSAFDPALARFAKAAATWVRSASILALPKTATLSLQPGLVARAVIGHLLAALPVREMGPKEWENPANVAMREFFLGSALSLPPSLQLLVWPYASSRTIVGKSFVRIELRPKGTHLMDLLKFYPLAFAVLFDGTSRDLPHLCRISPENAGTVEGACEISIPLISVPQFHWPERPTDDGFLLVSANRFHVIDRAAPR